MNERNVLSLFDGMSCLQIVLTELGIPYDNYLASEIEKEPIRQTMHNFPNTIQIGDVRNVDVSQLPYIQIIGAGSPCQSFSFAGKRAGMSTVDKIEVKTLEHYLQLKAENFEFEGQSYLFWEFMRILDDVRKYNPNVIFFLENVEMGKKWEGVLSRAIGCYPMHVDSARFSAQHRKRVYWSNISQETRGMFGEKYTHVPLEPDKHIYLKDIIDHDVPEKYYLNDKMLQYFDRRAKNFNAGKVNIRDLNGKASTITASSESSASCDISDNFLAIDSNGKIFTDKAGALLARYSKGASNFGGDTFIMDTKLILKKDQTKAGCFTAGGNSGGLHSDMDLIAVAERGRNGKQQFEPRFDGKTNCITSVSKDNYLGEPIGCDFRSDEGLRIKKDGKSGTICARARNDESCGQLLLQGYKIRRFTPNECRKLQSIPDRYKFISSDTAVYKMLGNGWEIEAVKQFWREYKRKIEANE